MSRGMAIIVGAAAVAAIGAALFAGAGFVAAVWIAAEVLR